VRPGRHDRWRGKWHKHAWRWAAGPLHGLLRRATSLLSLRTGTLTIASPKGNYTGWRSFAVRHGGSQVASTRAISCVSDKLGAPSDRWHDRLEDHRPVGTPRLAARLTATYGRGWSEKQLWHCLCVAETFPAARVDQAVALPPSAGYAAHRSDAAALPQ